MANTDKIGKTFESVDPRKRAFLKSLVVGTVFAAPMVVSFSMKGISTYGVHAAVNGSVQVSDRAAKEGFAAVDSALILDRIAHMPIQSWRYTGETPRHIGPMAQDFAAAFGLGSDDRHIHSLDANGVALAAIQALLQRVGALEAELATLRVASAG